MLKSLVPESRPDLSAHLKHVEEKTGPREVETDSITLAIYGKNYS